MVIVSVKMFLSSRSFFIAMTLVSIAKSFPTGAPDRPEVCRSMRPGHKNTSPQTRPPPFEIIVSQDKYKASETLKVTLTMTDGEKFQGFMIQARLADGSRFEPIGNFLTSDGRASVICAGLVGNALTHSNASGSSSHLQMTFDWQSPSSSQGHIVFKVTVVLTHDRYWVAEPSKIIMDSQAPTMPKSFEPTPPLPADAISTAQCGKSKSCYRNPPDCEASQCDILAVWSDSKDYVDFQLTADSEGWVAIGFSDDMKMGNDAVFECAWNESLSQVIVRHSRNREDRKDNVIVQGLLGLRNTFGWVTNRRISCYFRRDKRDKEARVQGQLFNDRYHLLLAKGRVDKNGGKLRHTIEANKYPYVSTQKVKISDLIDITHTARYVLVKVHGCLMLIGWMMCASTALILTKYYKPMWPNDRLCGRKVWFSVHSGCMLTCLLCTIVAFILIFIHASGYSQMPDYPDKAHPPLGICTTILCILNPLIALCRPSEKSKWRPIFNWIHWLFGTCGAVLATPTIFIGLNLPKSHVPWWATWVMVAFMLFHLIIELLLEIHGCLNSKKQEYRNQDYEKRKKYRLRLCVDTLLCVHG